MSEIAHHQTPPTALAIHATQPTPPLARPTGERASAWRAYWREQDQPWRTEPEIDAPRQAALATLRATPPNIPNNIYPFRGVTLTRADLEWLLATHEHERGPVDAADPTQRERPGLDLRGADLRGAALRGLPLAHLNGGLSGGTDEQQALAAIQLSGADLREAHLERANLYAANLTDANLEGAWLHEATLIQSDLTRSNLRAAHAEGATFRNAHMEKATLTEGHFEGATLSGAHLEAASLSKAHLEAAALGGARLEGAFLRNAHLEGAKLFGAHLENATLAESHLHGAQLRRAHLEGATLSYAHLEGLTLPDADLTRIRLWRPDFPAQLPPADLRLCFFDAATVLQALTLGDDRHGYATLADLRWGDANLAVLSWSHGKRRREIILGDEREAHQRLTSDGVRKTSLEMRDGYESALRANRQLALALQAQGLNEDAARFAYRAQRLQRIVLRRDGRLGQWLFSLLLDGIAGYGYRPGRSLIAYLLVVLGFALAYFALGRSVGPTLSPQAALVFSVTSFHGRGFFPGGISLDSPITQVAAAEALVGLLIEISFIATFTQRFFGK